MVSRRRVLALLGCGVGAVAGCAGRDPSDGSPSDGRGSPSDTPVPTEAPGTPTAPSFATVGLTTTGVQCGDDARADVTVTGDRLRVVGAAVAPDPCHRAVLRSASVRDGTASLDVRVSDDPTADGPCEQCLAEVGFELTGRFVGGRPARVAVAVHGERPETFGTAV
ncbi:MAG: hypothetical protein ABEJ23_03680 [Haloarculaceae archaeon]